MMKCLVKKEYMNCCPWYFRNPCVAAYEECPDGVLDVYHLRNHSERVPHSYMKENLGLETHINGNA